MQLSGNMDDSRVSAIRSRDCDITIDLSGWTGGNFIAGFYLSCPQSKLIIWDTLPDCIANHDYWIGDHYLFPLNFLNGQPNRLITPSLTENLWILSLRLA